MYFCYRFNGTYCENEVPADDLDEYQLTTQPNKHEHSQTTQPNEDEHPPTNQPNKDQNPSTNQTYKDNVILLYFCFVISTKFV